MPRISQNNRVFHSGKRLGSATREFVLELANEGFTLSEIMEHTKLSLNTIKKYQVNMELPRRGKPPLQSFAGNHLLCNFICIILIRFPTLYLKELSRLIYNNLQLLISITSLNRLVHTLEFKNRMINIISHRRREERIQSQRHQFSQVVHYIDRERFVFIDESHFSNKNLCRKRGWGIHHWDNYSHDVNHRSYSLIAALGYNGVIYTKIKDTSSEGVRGGDFESFLLDLSLRLNDNSILILDNARVHKTDNVNEILTELNINYMFLPPYSPDLNPIELYFNLLKRSVRGLEFYNLTCIEAIIFSILNFNNNVIPTLFNHFDRVCRELRNE